MAIDCAAVLLTIKVYPASLFSEKECTMFAKKFQKSFSSLFILQDRNCPDKKKVMKFFFLPCDSLSLTMADRGP
jgi:hypothetical protein